MSIEDAVLPFSKDRLPLRDLAHDVLDAVIEDFRDPAFRAEFGAATITAAVLARSGLPFLPAMLASLAAGRAARWAYESVEDIRGKLGGSDAPGGV